jgi:hypothetical protein
MSTPVTLSLLPWVHSRTMTRVPDMSTVLVPELVLLAAHALELQPGSTVLERGEDPVDLVEVDLVLGAEVADERLPARLLVRRQPRVVGDPPPVRVQAQRLEVRQGGPDVVVVPAAVHQAAQAAGPEDA